MIRNKYEAEVVTAVVRLAAAAADLVRASAVGSPEEVRFAEDKRMDAAVHFAEAFADLVCIATSRRQVMGLAEDIDAKIDEV